LSSEHDDAVSLNISSESASESEFELSLDPGTASRKKGPAPRKTKHDKDIFETDFEVPSLEEESGSEAVALDTGDASVGSSDFDIALSGTVDADGSDSEAVPLDESEEDDGTGRRGKAAPALEGEEPGFGDLEEGEAAAAEEEEEEVVVGAAAAVAAPWGAMPVMVLVPCVIVMFLVGLMGLELVQGISGFKQPGPLSKAISSILMPK
jgi:hypothetical protein